ncbi:MAG: hypothetical protein QXX77_10490 [Candidatus Methanosuratincola sp.]|jgi:hypothetical protein
MIVDDIIDSIRRYLEDYPYIPCEKVESLLKEELRKKKYDVQDEALIEKILKDEESKFGQDFKRAIEEYLASSTNPHTDDVASIVARTFLSCLEKTVDLYYNVLISRHFAES